ncbi:protein containing RagB/SusD domain protein, partial [human gut metagenome]
GKSDQPFILMRYAEVMLNAAEAAVELALAGEPSPDGSDLMQVATDAVNEIRERAGAELLESNIQPTTEGRNIVRKERRKELAFEHKTKWDLRRWRVWHYEGRDGFWGETRDKNTYSNNVKIPVPPLDVQNRIVNVLDNFEKNLLRSQHWFAR